MERLRSALLELSRGRPGRDQAERPDTFKVAIHMDVLERRAAGELDWTRELDRGRNDAARAYADMVEQGGQLPRYAWGPIFTTVDLFNPKNEAEQPLHDPAFEPIELVAHGTQLYPWASGTLLDGTPINLRDPSSYAKMTKYGEAFGEAIAMVCEHLQPHFAFADLKNTAPFPARAATTGPAPYFWEWLWPVSYWSPELLAEHPGLTDKLTVLALKPEELAKVDAFERTGLRTVVRDLKTGGLFVQYRTILGGEGRTSRSTVDAPLAAQAGLKALF